MNAVHSSFIHSSWKTETTQAFTDRWMDKRIIVNGILYGLEQEGYFWHLLQHKWTWKTVKETKFEYILKIFLILFKDLWMGQRRI